MFFQLCTELPQFWEKTVLIGNLGQWKHYWALPIYREWLLPNQDKAAKCQQNYHKTIPKPYGANLAQEFHYSCCNGIKNLANSMYQLALIDST